MKRVLLLVERSSGGVAETTLEALTVARQVTEMAGGDVEGVFFGSAAEDVPGQLSRYGIGALHQINHDLLTDYAPEAWAESLVQLAAKVGPTAIVAAGTDRGNEVLAHVGARMAEALAANCISLDAAADGWTVTRTRWGGSLLEEARLVGDVKLLTVAPHALEVAEAGASREVEVHPFSPELTQAHVRTRVKDRSTQAEGVNLATAPVVVSGGRGVGSAEGFKALDELAELLGGVVGCSRAATNQGWRPHSDQVGQTGTRIAPALYIACGISGATQHWVGCAGAKNIISINTDPEAPMMSQADYAVIGDLHKVMPAIVEEIRRRKRL